MRLPLLFIGMLVASGAEAQTLVGSESSARVPSPVELDTTGLFLAKLVRVGDDVFIAGQPSAEGLREMKRRGVATVVNLRSPPEMERLGFDEAALVEELGMRYVYLPMRAGTTWPYSPEALRDFAEVMKSADGKVLLHCTIAWRASHLWTAYLIKERRMAVADALAHGRAINLMDDHRMDDGQQPIELFLGATVPGLGRP